MFFLFYSSSFRIYSSKVGNAIASPVHITRRSSRSAHCFHRIHFSKFFQQPKSLFLNSFRYIIPFFTESAQPVVYFLLRCILFHNLQHLLWTAFQINVPDDIFQIYRIIQRIVADFRSESADDLQASNPRTLQIQLCRIDVLLYP